MMDHQLHWSDCDNRIVITGKERSVINIDAKAPPSETDRGRC